MVKYETIAKRLRELRKERGLSTEALGAMVDRSGKTIEAYETGTSQPNGDMLVDLCIALDCRISDFFPKRVTREEYQYALVSLDGLSDREQALLDAFRRMDERDRRTVEALVASLSAPIAGGNGGERVA